MTDIPPGNYPPPPAGGLPPAGAPPNNNLVLGILVTIFCCLPFGIVSIIYASKVDGLAMAGDIAGARGNETVDGRLVTGQNPYSTPGVADAIIRATGRTPVSRTPWREPPRWG